MSDRIYSSVGTQSLQYLSAQQAFRPRTAVNKPAPEEPDYPAFQGPSREELDLPPAGTGPKGLDPQRIGEVQAIAERAGYVGLSEKAIQRAYLMGESLLADYRV